MPFQPLRFVHAAQVQLDEPLRDVGKLSDDIRAVVLSATSTAFQRVVDECIQQQVDFLLLTENSFCESSRSLKARLGLVSEFRRLHAHDVGVFVLPGKLDPAESWRAIPHLPDNVTTLSSESGEPVAVMRDGQVIATIACVSEPDPSNADDDGNSRDETDSRRPFAIGLVPVDSPNWTQGVAPFQAKRGEAGFDYLAFGANERKSIDLSSSKPIGSSGILRSLAHSPGALQGLDPQQSGPSGASLVDVSVDGAIDCTLLPVAPIRREVISVTVNAESTRDQVIEQMQSNIDQLSANDGEQVWFVEWHVVGDGYLWHSLEDQQFRDELLAENEVDVLVGMPLVQSIECWPPTRLDGEREVAAIAGESSTDSEAGLQVEYLDRLTEQAAICRQWMEECLRQDARESGIVLQLQSILAELDVDDVVSHAHRVGNRWLTKSAG